MFLARPGKSACLGNFHGVNEANMKIARHGDPLITWKACFGFGTPRQDDPEAVLGETAPKELKSNFVLVPGSRQRHTYLLENGEG